MTEHEIILTEAEKQLVANLEFIPAIRSIRNRLQSTLLEAKTAVDSYRKSLSTTTDSNVTRVCEKMQARAQVGLKKYGCSTERTDYTLLDWLINAQEEAMDQVIYLEAAIQKLKPKN